MTKIDDRLTRLETAARPKARGCCVALFDPLGEHDPKKYRFQTEKQLEAYLVDQPAAARVVIIERPAANLETIEFNNKIVKRLKPAGLVKQL